MKILQIPKAFLNWSSGKDASMALYEIQKNKQFVIEKLLTTINQKYNRVSMHGLHKTLLEVQAKATGISLEVVELDENVTMESYEKAMYQKLEKLKEEGLEYSIFGDIFLEDLREYRENQLKNIGIEGVFPLWKKDTKRLIQDFILDGFEAIVVSCNAQILPKSFCGRLIDESFLNDLPANVDACGENGEFHTFCFNGPIFDKKIHFEKGDIVYKTYPAPSSDTQNLKEYGFWYLDLKLNSEG